MEYFSSPWKNVLDIV